MSIEETLKDEEIAQAKLAMSKDGYKFKKERKYVKEDKSSREDRSSIKNLSSTENLDSMVEITPDLKFEDLH